MIGGRLRVVAAIGGALALAVACGPAEEKKAVDEGADAIAPRNPFFGTWEMKSAKIAPWWDENGDTPTANPEFTRLVFEAEKSTGPKMATCDRPRYAVNIVPPRALFEGNLPDPQREATELGFKPGDVTSMNFGCLSPASDVSLDFPMVNEDTIMLGLDNVIYTYRRTG